MFNNFQDPATIYSWIMQQQQQQHQQTFDAGIEGGQAPSVLNTPGLEYGDSPDVSHAHHHLPQQDGYPSQLALYQQGGTQAGPSTVKSSLHKQKQASRTVTPTAGMQMSGSFAGSKKGTKRPRPTLSCTECVRRKSKCDRTIPCATCIKRGTPERCRVDDEEQRPSQPFAQAKELQNVKERLQKIEQLLLLVAPDQARTVLGNVTAYHEVYSPDSPPQHDTPASAGLSGIFPHGQGAHGHGRGQNGPPNIKRDDSEDEADGNGNDDDDEMGDGGEEAEKAAFALESIAVAGREPMSLDDGAENPPLPLTSHARIRESQLRSQELDFLISMLPDWTLSRSLVDDFFRKVAWHNHVVHQPTFEAQYSALRELVDQHRMAEVDPAWLSLYFMVIASGMFFSPNRTDITPAHQAEYTNTWVLGAQRALTLADWSGKPQLTCIQAVVLLPVVLMHAGGIKRLASWIAAALRMAQLLDLHKLDDKSRHHLKASPINAFGPVEREIGKRLYFSLTHGEVNFTSRWLGLGHTSHAQHPIPNILNIDDIDLLANPPVPKAIEQATVSSFQVIRASTMAADVQARLTGSDARVHKYETVLAFDQRTRELLNQLPAYFKYDRSDDSDIQAIVAQRPYIAYQRCTILFGLNNRLLRAHRPFMTKGYFDPKYAYSTESCVKAAKVIIAAQRALRDIFDAADRMYNCLLYCFSSAIVLLVDNFHRLSSPEIISSTSELDTQRHEALDVLFMLRREAGTSTIAQAGAKVLEGILNEENQRRTQRGLPGASEDFSRPNTPGAEAPTLREVVERIASVSQRPLVAAAPGTRRDSAGQATGEATIAARVAKSFTDSRQAPASPTQSTLGLKHTAAAPSQQQFSFTNPSNSSFPLSASIPPSLQTGQAPSLGMTGLNMPSFMTGGNGLGGDVTLSAGESEDLLRSLGFFEVGNGLMPSIVTGSGPAAGTDGDVFGMLGSDSRMASDLSWLDGLGEW